MPAANKNVIIGGSVNGQNDGEEYGKAGGLQSKLDPIIVSSLKYQIPNFVVPHTLIAYIRICG